MDTSLERIDQPSAIEKPQTTLEMIASGRLSVEQMKEAFAFQQQIDADNARKAFNEAFTAFKAVAGRVVKNTMVNDGPLKGRRYLDLFGAVNAIVPMLSPHGLSHSWKLTKDEPGWMEVTCTLRHVLGHYETNAMGSAPDTGAGRNAIQARGSAKSYLERYTLLGVTGMAASDADDDGRAADGLGQAPAGKRMDERTLFEHVDAIESSPTMADLEKNYLISLREVDAIGDAEAKVKIVAAKKRMKTELAKGGA